jgi:hypothetical protein
VNIPSEPNRPAPPDGRGQAVTPPKRPHSLPYPLTT